MGLLRINEDTSMQRGDILRHGAQSGDDAWERLSANTSGQILVGDGTDIVSVAVSGDATLGSDGTLTVADLTVSGQAAGDLLYKSAASTMARLAIGTAGQFLQVNAGATAPQWSTLSGDGSVAVGGAFTALHETKWPFRIPESMTVDSDGYNGSLIHANAGDLTLTEAAAAFSKVYDATNTDYQDLATSSAGAGYTANYQHIPDTVADNDAWYMGGTIPFCQVYIDITTAVSYTGDCITWEYYNGATWAALTIIYDHTGNATTTGTRPFQQDGSISFIPPADWASTTVDGQAAYWIRARVSTVANHVGENGTTNSKEHQIASPTDGFTVPHACTITDLRIADEAGTVHGANPINFVLFNFTKGTYTAALAFAISKRTDYWSSLTLACDAGDVLGILITQEDGTNEAGPATFEIGATLS